MPSRNVGETSSDDDCQAVSMDMGLLEALDTIVEPLFCGQLELSEPKCILHHMRPLKCVAFEGTLTGRRFYGCPVQENGVNYGVVEWVDGPWPPVLQRCLDKLWEMFHEQNCGRDGKVDRKMNQKQMDDVEVQMEEDFEKKKEVEEKVRLEVQMEKLKLAKEQRCILQSQADIIKNTRKAMKDVELDRDLLKKEKANLSKLLVSC
ncbi:hypothetical protein D1007_31571 [Hordeum vulgare]|nr:hypothetical protein D1007_31571 [Hordeum vulgare]